MLEKKWAIGAMLAMAVGFAVTRADDAPAAKSGITPVTLHMPQAAAQDVFDELAKQGHVKFVTNGNVWDQSNAQALNDIDITNVPFWTAVNQVCDLWNIDVQEDNSGIRGASNRIMLSADNGNQKRDKLPTFEQDGFVVQAIMLTHNQNVNYTQPKFSSNTCFIQLRVLTDPAMHIMPLDQTPSVQVAEDDEGHSMLPKNSRNMFYGGGQQQQSMMFNCNVPLTYPEKHGKKITDLQFTLNMQGSSTMDSLSVDKPLEAAASTKNFGALRVTFHSLKKVEGGNYKLSIGLGGGTAITRNGWQLLQSGQLLDAKGHAFDYAGGSGGGRAKKNALVEYEIDYDAGNDGEGNSTTGEPVKWVLELPGNPQPISLPVEFKDLQLPE